MSSFFLGTLQGVPASERTDLAPARVIAVLEAVGILERVGIVEIDPELSDTAATQDTYSLEASTLANCVIVTGKREGDERIAACLIPASTRADINNLVKRRLDVRKASFMSRELAVESTGMEFGGITPVGLPAGWPILVDAEVTRTPLLVIGSGIRKSKLLFPGDLFEKLPGVEIVEELGRPIAPVPE